MKIGKQGLDLIKSFEGLQLGAYKCPAGVWTIGYGSTKGVSKGMRITEAGAEHLLKEDLMWVEDVVNSAVKVPMSQAQYDALCCFVYNIGGGAFKSSTLLRKLNRGDYEGAANEFRRWNKAKGIVLPGLVRRRAAEEALFTQHSLTLTGKTSGLLEAIVGLLRTILSAILKSRS